VPLRTEQSNCRHGSAGQALTEFALALPILVLLMFTVIDLGRLIAANAAAVTASREGARYGAAVGTVSGTPRYMNCAGIRQAVRAVTGGLIDISDDNRIQISYIQGDGTATTQSCTPHGTGPVDAEIVDFDRVVVEVSATLQPITPVVGSFIGPFDIVSIDRRTIVKVGP
jgi:Flp pilus assembly protein TadG